MGVLLGKWETMRRLRSITREPWRPKNVTLGVEHPNTLLTMGNMGVLLSDMGQYEEAEKYYKKALEAQERVLEQNTQTFITLRSGVQISPLLPYLILHLSSLCCSK